MSYERLQREAEQHGVYIYEKPMKPTIKGLYADNVICINRNLSQTDKACTIAEELGHYHTSYGDILDQTILINRKQEYQARQWAYEKLIPLSSIVQALHSHVRNRYELAEYLCVTETFLQETIERYIGIYGLYAKVDERHYIYFDPLRVLEMFE